MFVSRHIILSLFFSSALFFIFPHFGLIAISIIFLSSILIDVDHYLYYVYSKKDISLKNAYDWFISKTKVYHSLSKEQKRNVKYPLFLFHGIEFLILIIALSFFNKIFLYVLIGISFHYFLDFIDIIIHQHPLYVKMSFVYNYFRNKTKKNYL